MIYLGTDRRTEDGDTETERQTGEVKRKKHRGRQTDTMTDERRIERLKGKRPAK